MLFSDYLHSFPVAKQGLCHVLLSFLSILLISIPFLVATRRLDKMFRFNLSAGKIYHLALLSLISSPMHLIFHGCIHDHWQFPHFYIRDSVLHCHLCIHSMLFIHAHFISTFPQDLLFHLDCGDLVGPLIHALLILWH